MGVKSDTREKILDTAEALFQQRGFNGFSYKDIAEPLSIRNAAVHYHFPSKGDLGAALIQRYRDLLRRNTAQFMQHGGDARMQLEGYLQFTLKEFEQGIPLCPGGVIAADFASLPEVMREKSEQMHRELQAWLTRVLEVGREQGVFEFRGEPEEQALLVMTAVQGARQVARFGGRKQLERTFNAIRRDLGIEPAAA